MKQLSLNLEVPLHNVFREFMTEAENYCKQNFFQKKISDLDLRVIKYGKKYHIANRIYEGVDVEYDYIGDGFTEEEVLYIIEESKKENIDIDKRV